MDESVVFDDLPWEIKLEIFRLAWDNFNLIKVSKEWRNLVWKYGKKKDEFVRMYINQLTRNGYLELLKWLSTQIDITDYWDIWTCAHAAEGGHLEVLKWLTSEGCPWDEWTCTYAAEGGHLDVLKWLTSEGCPWDEWTCTYAAEGGHLDVLEWLRENGCPE